VDLYFYEDKFYHHIIEYQLSEEQLMYTDTPFNSIQLQKDDSNRSSILAIENDQLVTFFVLHKNEGVKPYSNNSNAILLRAFSTDYRYQGKGYAKKSLLLLPSFITKHFRDINEIVLAVNVKNEVAQNLYKKCGFIDEGVRKMGRKGELMILSYYL